MKIEFKPIGNKTVLIEWPKVIDPNTNREIIEAERIIQLNFHVLLIDTVITYHSLTLYFRESIDVDQIIHKLKQNLLELSPKELTSAKQWKVPVCYELEFAWDLEELSQLKKCSIEEIIRRHTAPLYHLYFIGFLPGFMYLGGLDKKLVTERKASPRLRIDKGAVAIAGDQAGIYPQDSPGGWQIIGKTPIQLFDPHHKTPSPFSSGDQLKFYSISRKEFESIAADKDYTRSTYA